MHAFSMHVHMPALALPHISQLTQTQTHNIHSSASASAAAPGAEASGEPALSTGDMGLEYLGVAVVLAAAAAWCGLWLTILLKNAGNMIKYVK